MAKADTMGNSTTFVRQDAIPGRGAILASAFLVNASLWWLLAAGIALI